MIKKDSYLASVVTFLNGMAKSVITEENNKKNLNFG